MRRAKTLLATVVLLLALPAGLLAQTYSGVVVSGQANIFGSGFGDAPAPQGGGGGVIPVESAITVAGPAVLTFSSVTGLVRCAVFAADNGPDGGVEATGDTYIISYRDISGIIHPNRTMFLVGAFRDSSPGNPGGTPPARLSFLHPENFLTLAPQLNQTFFIGDGRTDDTNTVQTFVVPTGATRLFLGFADSFSFGDLPGGLLPGAYSDNTGELVADFTFSTVPEPSTLLLVFGAVGGGWLARRKIARLQAATLDR